MYSIAGAHVLLPRDLNTDCMSTILLSIQQASYREIRRLCA